MEKDRITSRLRKFLYFVHRHTTTGIMPPGVPCQVEHPAIDVTHGDIVHPCVRYIEEGFEGHHWWLVYTPFYSGNDDLENPVLCYADNDASEAPTAWKYYCTIKEKPECGYNSDPTLLFKDGSLYVFWREVKTPAAREYDCYSATFGCRVHQKTVIPYPCLCLRIQTPTTTPSTMKSVQPLSTPTTGSWHTRCTSPSYPHL